MSWVLLGASALDILVDLSGITGVIVLDDALVDVLVLIYILLD